MLAPSMRALLGFIAAAISVLTIPPGHVGGFALALDTRARDAATVSHRRDSSLGRPEHRQPLLLGRGPYGIAFGLGRVLINRFGRGCSRPRRTSRSRQPIHRRRYA